MEERRLIVHAVRLVCIDPLSVRSIWPLAAPLLRKAVVKTGLADFAVIECDVFEGRSLLWVAWNGSAIVAAASTSLQQTEAGRVCVIAACAGRDMHDWLPLIGGIEAYATSEGCRCVRIFGRKGWARVLAGYRETYAIIDKPLCNA